MPTPEGLARTEAGRREMLRRSAHRAVDDPRQLARAARIVQAAIARKALSPTDVLPDGDA